MSISYIVLAVLATALALYVLTLAYRIHYNVSSGHHYRDQLLSRLSSLRLNTMLDALGIDKNRYAYTQSILDIDKQMKACTQCHSKAVCDSQLSHGAVDADEITFCDNQAVLRQLIEQQHTRTSGN